MLVRTSLWPLRLGTSNTQRFFFFYCICVIVCTTAGKLREALTCQLKEQIAQLEAKDALITRLRSRLENSDALYEVSAYITYRPAFEQLYC
jgi:diphthamide synthase subunit DPH2